MKYSSFVIFLVSQIIFVSDQVLGQGLSNKPALFGTAQTPSLPDVGVLEKLLRDSRQKTIIKPESKKPQITIEDSRKLTDPGAGPSFMVKKIELEGNTIFSQETLEPIVRLGGELELTLGILSLFAQEVNTFYAQKGFYLTKVYIPEQEIIDGIVKFKIVEGKIGKITVKGNKHISTKEIIGRFSAVLAEKVASESTLERTLLELNDTVGLNARSILTPGEIPGTSDILLEITEDRMFTFGFSANNYGAPATGAQGFTSSLSLSNVFSLGDNLSYNRTFSNGDQLSETLSFFRPLTHSGKSSLSLSYTKSSNLLGGAFAALNGGGRTEFFNIDLGHKLIRTRSSGVNLNLGFDVKHLINFAAGDITSVDKVLDYYFTVSGNLNDSLGGSNIYSIKLQQGWERLNPLASRVGGNYDSLVSSLSLTRIQPTGLLNSYFIMSNRGQITNKRVPSANLFSIGGNGTVRGYPLGDGGAGDWGYSSSIQYIIPIPWDLNIHTNKLKLSQVLSLTSFVEHGAVFIIEGLEGEDYFNDLTGIGGGLQFNLPKGNGIPNLTFNLSYGYPMSKAPSDGSSGIIYVDGAFNW